MDQGMTVMLACIFIAAVTLNIWVRSKRRVSREKHAVEAGLHTLGRVTAVRKMNGFDRERGHTRVWLRLEYSDPSSGQIVHATHYVNMNTPHLPLSISGPGASKVNISAIRGRHLEMKAYRQELEADGLSSSEVKQAVMDRAVAQAAASTGGLGGEADSEGFIQLKEEVIVDVYLHKDSPNGDGLHIAFRP